MPCCFYVDARECSKNTGEPGVQKYKDLGGDSGISRYEFGEDFIEVEFKDGKKYQYDYQKKGHATSR